MPRIKYYLAFLLLFFTVFFSNAQNTKNFYFCKSYAFLQYQEFDSALIFINSAIECEPQNSDLYIQKSNIFAQQEQFKTAISIILPFQTQNQKIVFLLSQFYAIINNVDSSLFFLNKYLQTSYPLTKAEIINNNSFDKIRNSSKWNDFWSKAKFSKPQVMLNEAYYDFSNNNIFDAIDQSNLIIKQYKQYFPAYEFKADIMLAVKNYSEAVKNYGKALDFVPSNAKISYKCGLAFLGLNNFAKAVEMFNFSLKNNPFQPEIFYNLAMAYNGNHQYNQAVDAINTYLSFFYKDTSAILTKANILANSGDFIASITILNQLMQTDKYNPSYYFQRGQDYLQAKSYSQAYHDFSQCLDINPQMTDVYYFRGQALWLMQQKQQACDDWQNAIKNHDYRANKFFYPACENLN